METTREPGQRSASLEQGVWQPRLAMEADVTIDTKTGKRTEGAAAAEQVISGDNSFCRGRSGPDLSGQLR